MQVSHSASCPLLLESDYLSLSSAFSFKTHTLHDRRIGIDHQILLPGDTVFNALAKGVAYSELRLIARDNDIADLQLSDMLGFLNKLGGLQRRRTIPQQGKALLVIIRDLLLVGIRYEQIAWRQPASPLALLAGLLRASYPLLLTTPIVVALFMGTGWVSAPLVLATGAFGLLFFLLTLWTHEMTHAVIILRADVTVDVLQRGMRLGIIHQRLPNKIEVTSALAGPLAGFALGLCTGLAAHLSGQRLIMVTGFVIAIFHCASLLPWYGDGATIWKTREKA